MNLFYWVKVKKTGGRTRPSLISDAFEAFVGALYLDQGLDTVWKFAEKVIFPYVEDDELVGVVDFKTQFQEYVHRQNKGDVTYRLIKEEVLPTIGYLLLKLF